MTHKDDVQREIEENQRRARDEQDVGLEEDVLNDQDRRGGTIFDDLGDAIFGDGDEGDSRQRDVEYDDDEGANRNVPD